MHGKTAMEDDDDEDYPILVILLVLVGGLLYLQQQTSQAPEAMAGKNEQRSKRREGQSAVDPVRSRVDGRSYPVSRAGEQQKAADLLGEASRRAHVLMDHIKRNKKSVVVSGGHDVTLAIDRLLDAHLGESLPLAEYDNPSEDIVGSNMDKGKSIEICLRSKDDATLFNPVNTVFRVLLHELAHSGDAVYRGDGDDRHGPVFRAIHTYLLSEAEKLGLYSCAEYDKSGHDFCGLRLTEDYCGG